MLKKRKIKFGKSSKDVDKIKSDFFSLNFKLLKNQNKINEFYRSQPKRQKCKACERKLIGDYFINHKIKYIQCKYCSHINGWHQDNKRFSNKIYVDEKVKYSKGYFENNIKKYKLRQKKIYNPKAEFLKSIFQLFQLRIITCKREGECILSADCQKQVAMKETQHEVGMCVCVRVHALIMVYFLPADGAAYCCW